LELLESIAALCVAPRGRFGLAGVVNYNFDDLLESALARRGVQYQAVFTEGDRERDP
jgi:hypothetical protein